MKILLDTCVWGKALPEIENAGHDVVWAGELAILRDLPHRGIVRLVDLSACFQASACMAALSRFAEELVNGAIVTVERTRVRVRPAGAG